MKKISFGAVLSLIILFIYVVTYNFIIKLGIGSSLYNVLFWPFFTILTYFLVGYKKNKAITKKQTAQVVFIYVVIYLLLMYFLGIVTGFYRSPFVFNARNVYTIILPYVVMIVAKELSRYMLMFKIRFSKKYAFLVTFLFIMVDIITVISMYEFTTPMLIFTFVGQVVIRATYDNVLEGCIVSNTGPIPSIMYVLLSTAYVYVIPIIPNLGTYLTIVINVLLPVILLLKVNNMHIKFRDVSRRKVNISKKYISIPLFMILIILVALVSGIFKYKMLAIASNSMLPVIARGDAIIYEKIDDINELDVGDILVLSNGETIYIHRIVEMSKKNKDVIIYTKGDNNAMNDSFVTTENDVIGVVRTKIKFIGYPTVLLSELFD